MTDWTPEQLKAFAEAGGWSERWLRLDSGGDRPVWVPPNGDETRYRRLEDFPNDLAACFEVLEKIHPDYRLMSVGARGSNFWVEVADVAGEWVRPAGTYVFWATKQDAIIAAVLAAKDCQ